MEKIQKIIANRGYTSRRKAEELIMQGKVYVDGKKASIGDRIDENANISIDGKEIVGTNNKVYFLLNKPRGVVSTVSDEKGRKTVVDFIDTDERIYPVGRLDYDTTGLLILTNDGDLANKLTHPKNKIIKTYLAKCAGIITKEQNAVLCILVYLNDRVSGLLIDRTDEFIMHTMFSACIQEYLSVFSDHSAMIDIYACLCKCNGLINSFPSEEYIHTVGCLCLTRCDDMIDTVDIIKVHGTNI